MLFTAQKISETLPQDTTENLFTSETDEAKHLDENTKHLVSTLVTAKAARNSADVERIGDAMMHYAQNHYDNYSQNCFLLCAREFPMMYPPINIDRLTHEQEDWVLLLI